MNARRTGAEAQENIATLENTLRQFRIEAQVVEIADGPTVTRYEIRLGEGIRVKKIVDLADNIKMSLAALTVRVEAPIPGKSAIGIEVPKKHKSLVTLRECVESEAFRSSPSKISFVLGKDVSGATQHADLARMPHLLVAGATNAGTPNWLRELREPAWSTSLATPAKPNTPASTKRAIRRKISSNSRPQ